MDNTQLIIEKQKFIERIANLIKEIQNFKQSKPEAITENYQSIEEELNDVIQHAEHDLQGAELEFNQMDISNSNSFAEYVSKNNINYKGHSSSSTGKTIIVHRDKPKNKKCPTCGSKLAINDNKFYCHSCNEYYDIASSSNKTKISSESTKHITKIVYLLCGVCVPPTVITNIIAYLRIWFLDYKYIINYLKYYSSSKIDELKRIYKEQYNVELDINSPPTIEPTAENTYNFPLYRFFTDEFYLMIEEVKKISKLTSNIFLESSELIENIFKNYIQTKSHTLPKANEKFTYNDHTYDIGNYIKLISLIPDYSETHPKNIIKKLFPNENLDFPGLMFNYLEEISSITAIPRRYAYLQVIPYVQHEIFRIPYPQITPKDRHLLIELIVEFNKYFKSYKSKFGKTNSNSPLFSCSVLFALKLPYFAKYHDSIIKLIPQKDNDSIESTNSIFFNFAYDCRKYLEKFRNVSKLEADSYESEKKDEQEILKLNSEMNEFLFDEDLL